MNEVQELGTDSVELRPDGGSPARSGDYLRVEFCPCCGAPAADAERRIASSPPAETLSPDRHGAFLSGYSHARVFFTYFECSKCSALFCPTYYRQSQLDGLYGRQAENMVSVPLPARRRTQESYARLLRRHSRMGGHFLESAQTLDCSPLHLQKAARPTTPGSTSRIGTCTNHWPAIFAG